MGEGDDVTQTPDAFAARQPGSLTPASCLAVMPADKEVRVRADGRSIVIVGAGQAGGSAAAFLRQFGWLGAITLLGEEPVAPYHRPPLSKAWLKGETDAAALALRPAGFYAKQGIDLRPGTRAVAIDRAGRRLHLADGEALPWDYLILATGARPRLLALPGHDLGGVLELRTVADAERLHGALQPGGVRLAVIGGGYIGLEVAASARALGAEVVVLEREARLLARVAGEVLAAFMLDSHRARGVVVELGAAVEALEGEGGAVRGVRLMDGRLLGCDVVLVGVGAVPNDELARVAGLECAGGVAVDLTTRTSDPAIHAVGDCTLRPLPPHGRMGRLESVPNAVEQARQAAAALCGRPPPPPEVPWFWSDQYELRLQMAGLPFGACDAIVRGDMAGPGFAVFHLAADGVLLAVEAVNAAPEFMAGRLMIGRGQRVARERLADPSLSMRDIAN